MRAKEKNFENFTQVVEFLLKMCDRAKDDDFKVEKPIFKNASREEEFLIEQAVERLEGAIYGFDFRHCSDCAARFSRDILAVREMIEDFQYHRLGEVVGVCILHYYNPEKNHSRSVKFFEESDGEIVFVGLRDDFCQKVADSGEDFGLIDGYELVDQDFFSEFKNLIFEVIFEDFSSAFEYFKECVEKLKINADFDKKVAYEIKVLEDLSLERQEFLAQITPTLRYSEFWVDLECGDGIELMSVNRGNSAAAEKLLRDFEELGDRGKVRFHLVTYIDFENQKGRSVKYYTYRGENFFVGPADDFVKNVEVEFRKSGKFPVKIGDFRNVDEDFGEDYIWKIV